MFFSYKAFLDSCRCWLHRRELRFDFTESRCKMFGHTAEGRKFYNSTEWIECKESYKKKRIAIDGGLCEDCHESLGYIVHHTIELNHNNYKNPDISLNHERLRYVCKKCHDKEHGYCNRERNPKRVIFDNNGDVIPVFVAENDEI